MNIEQAIEGLSWQDSGEPWTSEDRKRVAALIAALRRRTTALRMAQKCLINLAPYDPAVSEGVGAVVGMIGEALRDVP